MRHEHLDLITDLIRRRYPDWESFDDPEFQKDEIIYKREASEKARDLLDAAILSELVENQEYGEIRQRLEGVAHATNLLYLATPSTGDIGILYDVRLDESEYYARLIELLHGKGSTEERFSAYVEYVRGHGLPNKWTFPTYYLFLLYPKEEVFIKPRITKQFLALTQAGFQLGSPDGHSYERFRRFMYELREALQVRGAQDMIDVQSALWVAGKSYVQKSKSIPSEEKRQEFRSLFGEFVRDYLQDEKGQKHINAYEASREQFATNFDRIREAKRRNEDVTDAVLDGLLPHASSKSNLNRNAWIHPAPTINADLKKWYENLGRVNPSDWPRIAEAILTFIGRCTRNSAELADAVSEFEGSGHAKGFQSAFLSPALNAFRPDDFIIVNSKSAETINYLAGSAFGTQLSDYPDLNKLGLQLIEELAPIIDEYDLPEVPDADLFDAFCHWKVSVRQEFDTAVVLGSALAEPFNDIFRNPDEAEWAFDFFRRSAEMLGCQGPQDERFAFTIPSSHGQTLLRMNFGRWLILDFAGATRQLHLALLRDRADRLDYRRWSNGAFVTKEGEPEVVVYEIDISRIRDGDDELEDVWRDSIHFIGQKFGDWIRTPYRRFHVPRLSEAVFDDEVREEVLRKGLYVEQNADPASAFEWRAFELLDEIHKNPTREFYEAHKDAFKRRLEDPFQFLLQHISTLLPDEMRERLETERHVIARIPKNDYGRGGAWDFFWGAFYPEGGKRIRDAQLFVWMNREYLDAGFYIGEYGSDQRVRFLTNVTTHRDSIVQLLGRQLGSGSFVFGNRPDDGSMTDAQEAPDWEDWLQGPIDHGLRAAVSFSKEEVLSRSFEDLAETIADIFHRLYPLVILATSSDPLSELAEYLQPDDERIIFNEEYSIQDCVDEIGFPIQEVKRWLRAIDRKKQAIFYGPPGTGKTFVAKHLARHIVSESDGVIETVQFHPAYSYEDFMQGIRPKARADGTLDYPTVAGRFLTFCRDARRRRGQCVLIIDEISRANLSRVFGELMYLLEYRDEQINLASGEAFQIPDNVRIVGTMNTADRSIALVDHALRRRFAFIALQPRYEILAHFHEKRGRSVDGLIETIKKLNAQIGDPQFHVGISFFLLEDLGRNIEDVWRMEIEPYLDEYFFDQPEKVDSFRWDAIRERVQR